MADSIKIKADPEFASVMRQVDVLNAKLAMTGRTGARAGGAVTRAMGGLHGKIAGLAGIAGLGLLTRAFMKWRTDALRAVAEVGKGMDSLGQQQLAGAMQVMNPLWRDLQTVTPGKSAQQIFRNTHRAAAKFAIQDVGAMGRAMFQVRSALDSEDMEARMESDVGKLGSVMGVEGAATATTLLGDVFQAKTQKQWRRRMAQLDAASRTSKFSQSDFADVIRREGATLKALGIPYEQILSMTGGVSKFFPGDPSSAGTALRQVGRVMIRGASPELKAIARKTGAKNVDWHDPNAIFNLLREYLQKTEKETGYADVQGVAAALSPGGAKGAGAVRVTSAFLKAGTEGFREGYERAKGAIPGASWQTIEAASKERRGSIAGRRLTGDLLRRGNALDVMGPGSVTHGAGLVLDAINEELSVEGFAEEAAQFHAAYNNAVANATIGKGKMAPITGEQAQDLLSRLKAAKGAKSKLDAIATSRTATRHQRAEARRLSDLLSADAVNTMSPRWYESAVLGMGSMAPIEKVGLLTESLNQAHQFLGAKTKAEEGSVVNSDGHRVYPDDPAVININNQYNTTPDAVEDNTTTREGP